MPSGSIQRLGNVLFYFFILSALVAAQQQQQQQQDQQQRIGSSQNEHDSFQREQIDIQNLEKPVTRRTGKDTQAIISNPNKHERALATFTAPVGGIAFPSVRAHSASPIDTISASVNGLSRHLARSLQDWEVADIILLATVDGRIHAWERETGKAMWSFVVDRPMVQTTYHNHNSTESSDQHKSIEDDFLWIVEPSQDGALFVYSPASGKGMQRLGLTVKQLVEELSPYAGDEPPVVYTAEKKNILYTIGASTGKIHNMFSSAGAMTLNDQRCRRGNPLQPFDDQDCDSIGTITLGRTEYTVGIQDKHSGAPICTISYFEWGPNNRDKDLQGQYAATLDDRYIYTKHDGEVLALKRSKSIDADRQMTTSEVLLFSHKLSAPVARVYDVIRPHNTDLTAEGDSSLVILPQPIDPIDTARPLLDEVFVNCTENGGWYALSQHNYPLATRDAPSARCQTDGFYMSHVSLSSEAFEKQKKKLIGKHDLSAANANAGPGYTAAIGPGDMHVPSTLPPGPEPPRLIEAGPSVSKTWASSLPSPLTLILSVLISLAAIPSTRNQLSTIIRLLLLGNSAQNDGSKAFKVFDSVDVTQTIDEASESTLSPPEKIDSDHKLRFPEPAEETIFPQDPLSENEAISTETDNIGPLETPRAVRFEDDNQTPVQGSGGLNAINGSPVKSEKKARRGVRGGRKIKEKKLEQEQAMQRKRASSITKTDGVTLPAVVNLVDDTATATIATQIISVDASESPNVSGKIQINNLVINTDRLIGRGSAGTCVFEGSFGKRDVAVKRMLSQYYELASQEVVFLQENDDHPNVIRYYCQEKDQNFLYIAVELCQASLWDLFNPMHGDASKREAYAEMLAAIQKDVSSALFQIVLGLRHLHARRIIHRDIKPQNILIARPTATRKGPHLLISDFGLCKTLPENVSTLVDPTNNAGTCGWKAPELISQPNETVSNNNNDQISSSSISAEGININGPMAGVKRAADIFSLGCLFFWVLTGGSHPFDDREGWAQIRELNIKKNNPQNMHKLDLGSDTEEPMQLITAMLSHQPEDRPNVDEILQHPFFWEAKTRLQFLCDVSDHFEREIRDPPSPDLQRLESYSTVVIENNSGDFLRSLPRDFVDTLGKQRKYTGSKLLDLLRALRNKRNHYEDMPEEVKKKVGALPNGYLLFWTGRFPKLLMACYDVIRACGLENGERFKGYFEVEGQS